MPDLNGTSSTLYRCSDLQAANTMACRAAEETEGKRVELQWKLMGNAPKLAALLRRTAEMQKEVEGALSAGNSRTVNVIGEINTILGTA